MNQLMNDFAHFRELDDLANLLSGHVIEMRPSELLLLFDLSQYFFRKALVLSKGCHGAPLSPLDHFACIEKDLRHLSPTSLDCDLEKASEYSASTLGNIDHVSVQIITFQLEAANVSLQQDVYLCRCLVKGTFDWHRYLINELGQLNLLIFSDGDEMEFFGESEEAEDVNDVHLRLHVLIVDTH